MKLNYESGATKRKKREGRDKITSIQKHSLDTFLVHKDRHNTSTVSFSYCRGGELTFELPDNEKQCFFEFVDKGVESTLEFQVVTGGNYDVDMELIAPNGKMLYKDIKKQYDSFTWTSDEKGIFKFCFSNEFSTFTHKTVYFDLEVGGEEPLVKGMDAHATAMTMLETSAANTHEELNKVIDYQTHHKLREAQGRVHAEDLNERVLLWSIGQAVVILIIGVGQVLVLQSFFTEKKGHI